MAFPAENIATCYMMSGYRAPHCGRERPHDHAKENVLERDASGYKMLQLDTTTLTAQQLPFVKIIQWTNYIYIFTIRMYICKIYTPMQKDIGDLSLKLSRIFQF